MDLAEQLANERTQILAAEATERAERFGHKDVATKKRLDIALAKNKKSVATKPTELAVARSQESGVVMKEEYCATCDMKRPFYSIGDIQEMGERDVRSYNCMYCDTTRIFDESSGEAGE